MSARGAGLAAAPALDPEAWKAARILVVDDHDDNRAMLAMLLRRAGLGDILFAENGREGLRRVYDGRPDLVLLDVQMPVMDGLEMCRALRADAANAHLPVIFQTALSAADQRVACFDAGGNDMVAKPLNRREVVSRVRNHLEKRLLIRDLTAFQKRIEKELAQARALQAALAPPVADRDALAQRVGVLIQARFAPSSEVGGDLWTLFDLGGRRIGLLVADLTGHGVGAAMNAFRVHAMATALEERDDPGAFLTALNRALNGLLPLGQFATAFYGVLDLDAGALRYAAAGAPGPFLGGGADGPVMLDTRGPFLGVSPKAAYETRHAALPASGWLFVYSDAFSEAAPAQGGAALGEAGVGARCAEVAAATPPADRLARMLAEIDAGLRESDDDLTAIWVDWT